MSNYRSKRGKPSAAYPFQREQRVGLAVYGDDALRIAYGQYCKEHGLDRSEFVWDALNQASGGRIFKMADALRGLGVNGRTQKKEEARDG